MSEEEKEAIETMLKDMFFWQGKSSFMTRHRYKELSKKMYKEIEKLQKENEELKNYEYIKALLQQADDLKGRITELEKENEELRNFIQDNGMLYRRSDE